MKKLKMKHLPLIICLFYFALTSNSTKAQTYDVGNTSITADVGPLGNATATVPIFCPAGRLGIKPSVNLTFNSQANSGILGKGWNLSGLSVISRSGSNWHLDNGKQETVKFDNNDKLTFDGQRLLKVEGGAASSFISDNNVYRTEVDQFAKITYKNNGGNSYFIVDTKDGGKAFYGLGNGSQHIPVGPWEVLSWYISKSYDKNGNYMEYFYINNNGQIVLDQIKYTGFDATINGTKISSIAQEAPFNKIVFTYETSNHEGNQYINGRKVLQNKRVKTIKTYADATLARTYTMDYDSDDINSYLKKITEQNGAGGTLHPVDITWVEDGGLERSTGMLNINDNLLKKTGDFNGDGKADLLVINGVLKPYNGELLGTTNTYKVLDITKKTTTGDYTLLDGGTLPYNNISAILIGDVDNDGDDDIVFQTTEKFKTTTCQGGLNCRYYLDSSTYTYRAFLANTNKVTNTFSFVNLNNVDVYPKRTVKFSNNNYLTEFMHLFQFSYVVPILVEVDGDGFIDLMERETTGSREFNSSGDFIGVKEETYSNIIHLFLSTTNNYYNYPVSLPEITHFIPMDFNGNGKMDFLFSYKWNNKAEILEYDQSIAGFKHIYGIGNNQFPTQYHKHLKTGDFNGDGKTDLVYYINNKWMIAYSKGNDFVEYDATVLWFFHNYNPDWCSNSNVPEGGFYFDVADVNSDGKDDIIERHFHSNGFIGHSDNGLNIYYSKGFGFIKVFTGSNFKVGNTNFVYRIFNNNLIADFDGDGKKDILITDYNVSGTATGSIFVEYFKQYNYHLDKITCSNKHAYNITYKPLSNCNSNLYTRANNLCIGKALSIKPAMFVVESFNSKVDGLLDKTLLYKYTDLLYHKHGRGLMGFTSMTFIDEKTNGIINANKNIVVNEYKQNIEFLYKLDLYSTTNYLVANGNSPNVGNQISQKIYANNSLKTTSQNNNINFFYTNYLVETNNLTGLKKATCFEYNEDGNLIHTQESFMKINSASGADEFTNTSDYKYAQFNSWLPSSLIISRSCKMRNNGTNPCYTQNEMSYHANGNLRTSEYFKNNLSYYYKEIVNYDKYGNISSTSIDTANNPTTNTFKNKYFTYTNGRFLQKVKNALNQETLFEYEPIYGNKIIETTAGGLTTSYEYDNWGKLTKTTLPSGNYENITFNWMTNNTDNIYYYVTKTNNVGNTSWEYYNALDQKVRVKAIGFNGKIATQSWTYNSDNLPITESNLYDATNATTIANTKKITENTYDKYKRPETTTYNGTLMATYIYDYGTTKTTVKDAKNRLKSSTLNATGLIETSTDNGGTIRYKYGSHNQLIETVTNGSTISIDYNVQLNKISMNDPNTGTILYDYNAFGELIGQKDAKNNIYYYKYDELGRLIQKWSANDKYTYGFYNTVGNKNLNQIQKEEYKVDGVSKHKKEYAYYSNGLLQTISETAANNTTYVTKYYYNSNQRLLSIEYPTIHLKYLYDDYSNLKTIVNNSTNDLLWAKNSEDVDGKLTSETYGNGFTTNYTYDANRQLSGINSTHGSNSQVAFKANYTFELTTGNLLNRQYNNNTNEDFEYDNLDRLTMIEETINNNSKTKAYNYGANGNITSIENGGFHLLKYQSSKPNALSDHKFENTNSIRLTVPSTATTEHEYTYTKFDKIQHIEQSGEAMLDMEYGIDQQRIHMQVAEYGNITIDNYYVNSANLEIKNGIMYTYLYAEGKPFAIHKNNTEELYYLHLDNQGSLMAISDNTGNVIENRSYDAWGRPRNPYNWEYDQSNTFGGGGFGITTRGYTMHEHLEMFNLINMNGRLYDPLLGRMLSPDNYIQAPDNTQSYNRYSYCINNPLKYTDPSGDFFFTAAAIIAAPFTGGASLAFLPAAIGADVGMWQGGSIANGTMNPFKWDYGSGKTWGCMAGGALVGAASGGAANAVATSGMVGANTAAIATGSFISSVGTNIYTGGQTDVSISFGFGSYNITNGEFGYIGKEGNSGLENLGYTLGALANLGDILAGTNPGNVELRTENDINSPTKTGGKKDLIGHSQITDRNGKPLVDWGPTKGVSGLGDWVPGTNSYENGLPIPSSKMKWNPLTIKGVNTGRISGWNSNGNYNLLLNSCVTQTSRALNASGVFNIGIHPYLLNVQMYMRSLGVRPILFSHNLNH